MVALPPLQTLQALDRVERLGAVHAAAEALALSPSAVTHQLRRLEAQLGFAVVARSGRGVAITARARRYLAEIRPALDALEAATAAAAGETARGALTVAAAPGFAAAWLCPRLSQFQAAHGEIDLTIWTTERGGAAEVSVMFLPPEEAAPGDARLLTPEFFPVLAPGLAHQLRVHTGADLGQAPLLHLYSRDDWADWLARHAPAVDPRAPRGDVTFRDANLMFAAAEAGLGVALGDAITCQDALAKGALLRPIAETSPSERSYFLRLGPNPSPRAAAFAAWLTRALGEDAPR